MYDVDPRPAVVWVHDGGRSLDIYGLTITVEYDGHVLRGRSEHGMRYEIPLAQVHRITIGKKEACHR